MENVKTQSNSGLELDKSMNFTTHYKYKFAIVNKGIETLKKGTIIRLHLDRADLIYVK